MRNSVLEKICAKITKVPFAVRFPDGATLGAGDGPPAFTMVLRNEFSLAGNPVLRLGEAYMCGDLDVEGDWNAVAEALGALQAHTPRHPLWDSLFSRLAAGGSVRRRRNIQAHYDLGNDFYSLWLDPSMTYSCAYFVNPDDSLAQAQDQKADLTLRKLRLQPGMRLLDIGCGWGRLPLQAAREYGCHAVGLTLSDTQYAEGARRAERSSPGRVEIRLQDYLDMHDEQPFDRIVSVGMFEHVGKKNMPLWFETVERLLKPGGVCLLHTLTKPVEESVNAWTEKYIFPGGRIPSLREIIDLLPEHDFRTLHIENLRPHYAKTLDAWHANFSDPAVLEKVRAKFGEYFIRMWNLYLRMAAAALRIGALEVHQIVFSKGVNQELPLTLSDVYAFEPAGMAVGQ